MQLAGQVGRAGGIDLWEVVGSSHQSGKAGLLSIRPQQNEARAAFVVQCNCFVRSDSTLVGYFRGWDVLVNVAPSADLITPDGDALSVQSYR